MAAQPHQLLGDVEAVGRPDQLLGEARLVELAGLGGELLGALAQPLARRGLHRVGRPASASTSASTRASRLASSRASACPSLAAHRGGFVGGALGRRRERGAELRLGQLGLDEARDTRQREEPRGVELLGEAVARRASSRAART